MNDQDNRSAPPPPGNNPSEAPASAQEGSLGKGVGLFFLCVIAGGAACGIVAAILGSVGLPWRLLTPIYTGLGLLPWIAALVVAIRAASAGQRRTAIGVALGFGILVAIVLLLVAACFGLMSGMRFN